MTPSLTSLADHVIWPSLPRPPVTSSPCSLTPLPVGCCCVYPRPPSSLPPTSPPLCHCPSRSGTSLALPPGSNRWADDVTEGCDVTDDIMIRSDIMNEGRVTRQADIPIRCCDKPEHSTASDTTTTSIPDSDNTHMGCVRRSSDDSVSQTDRWDCYCHRCVSPSCHCHGVCTSCDSASVTNQCHLSDNVNKHHVNTSCHRLCCQVDDDSVCDITDRVKTRAVDSVSTRHIPENADTHIPQGVNPHRDCIVNKSHSSTSSVNNSTIPHHDTVSHHSTHPLNNHCHPLNHPLPDSPDNGTDTVTDSACACSDSATCRSGNNRLSGSDGGKSQETESYDCGHWPGMAPGLMVEWCRRCVKLPVALVLFLLLLLRRKGRRREVLQVPQVPQVPQVLLLLCLLLSRGLASPWIEEGAHSVKLRAQFCQPVPQRHLRNMLGEAFDPDRMSGDDPFAGDKRGGVPSHLPRAEHAALGSYSYHPESMDDFVDLVRNREEGGEEAWLREEGRDKEDVEEEEVVKRKDIMEEEEEEEGGFFPEQNSRSRTNPKFRAAYSHQPYLNMKRRKRQAEPSQGLLSPDFPSRDKKKDTDPMLHLRLLLGSRNRKLRRKLKKEFRKKARKLARKPPPWTCSISKVWGRLKDGFFPRYLLDGRCLTDKCFYRLYDCVPQRYRIKLLKRDPDYCNPLPTLGLNATYEQRWSVVRYYVTVGCNCQTADPLQVPLPFQGHITRS